MNFLKYLITVIIHLGAFLSFSVSSTAQHSIRGFTAGYCAFCLSADCRKVFPNKVSVEKEEKCHHLENHTMIRCFNKVKMQM